MYKIKIKLKDSSRLIPGQEYLFYKRYLGDFYMDIVDFDTATVFDSEKFIKRAISRFKEDFDLDSYEIVPA